MEGARQKKEDKIFKESPFQATVQNCANIGIGVLFSSLYFTIMVFVSIVRSYLLDLINLFVGL
jgi:hypothetical protein